MELHRTVCLLQALEGTHSFHYVIRLNVTHYETTSGAFYATCGLLSMSSNPLPQVYSVCEQMQLDSNCSMCPVVPQALWMDFQDLESETTCDAFLCHLMTLICVQYKRSLLMYIVVIVPWSSKLCGQPYILSDQF